MKKLFCLATLVAAWTANGQLSSGAITANFFASLRKSAFASSVVERCFPSLTRKQFVTAGLQFAKPLCSPHKRFECKQSRGLIFIGQQYN